jgi:spermidine/putrescine transport system permease protein
VKRLSIGRFFLPCIVGGIYAFLYAPIIVLIIFSFNKIAFPYQWTEFSLTWYHELFQSQEVLQATKNSLIVALTSSALSLMLSLLWSFFGAQSKMRWLNSLFLLNLMVPEIILALGLLLLFTFFSIPLGLITLIVAHTVLGLGYAIPILTTQFSEIDYRMIEASFDLGASLSQTFVRIVVPMLMPALVAAGLLVFIISLDDFLLSFFCAGSGAQTLSLYIFAMIRTGVSPVINALSTVLLCVSSVCVLLFSLLKVRTKIF